ncbi:MAG: hypothetical protein WBE26_12580 [Phycisphaerae bacterium]
MARRSPGLPSIPRAPEEISFGSWLDRNYPQIAGRLCTRQVLSDLHQQYISEQQARARVFQDQLRQREQQMREREQELRIKLLEAQLEREQREKTP